MKVHSRILLFGEYFVLLGLPGISLPLKNLTMERSEGSLESEDPWSPHKVKIENKVYQLNFPISAGLASSAMISLLETKKDLEKAYEYENKFHGKSSGIDVAGCFYDNPIIFKNKKIEPLQIKNFSNEGILVSYLGRRESQLLFEREKVLSLLKNFENEYLSHYQNMVDALRSGNYGKLLEAIRWNFEVQKELKILPSYLGELEGDAIKIMGAGFGGCVLSFMKQKSTKSTKNSFFVPFSTWTNF